MGLKGKTALVTGSTSGIGLLGELAVFLCPVAADKVRGQAWAVDGGWTAQSRCPSPPASGAVGSCPPNAIQTA